MKYQINITEQLTKTVEVEAENVQEAIEKAKNSYYDGEEGFILTGDDFVDTEFEMIGEKR